MSTGLWTVGGFVFLVEGIVLAAFAVAVEVGGTRRHRCDVYEDGSSLYILYTGIGEVRRFSWSALCSLVARVKTYFKLGPHSLKLPFLVSFFVYTWRV